MLPQLDSDGRVDHRNRRHGTGAREVGDQARGPKAEPVDDDPTEERREDDRQEVEANHESGERRAPVVVRTNHGIAVFAGALPPSEIASAV